MLRQCAVPGTWPTIAMCGRLVRHRNRRTDTATPATTPASTPSTNTMRIVAAMAAKSVLDQRKVRFSAVRSTSDRTATMMVAASVACHGNGCRGVTLYRVTLFGAASPRRCRTGDMNVAERRTRRT